MEIEKKPINNLIPANYNPRKDLKPGDSEYEKIKMSIEEFGYVDPIIINRDNTIIGGHQRWKVLKDLGYTDIDCVVVDVDKSKEKALNLALNKIQGAWDEEKLAEVLSSLQGEIDLILTGFDLDEIDRIISESRLPDPDSVQEDDFDFEAALEAEEVVSVEGDVWQFGRHRLVCGNSTNPRTFEVLMQDERAALVVTDPPYNVDYEGVAGKLRNDNMVDDDFYKFILKAYCCMYDSMDDGASIYVFHADSSGHIFRNAFIDAGLKLAQCCIWAKQSMVMGRQDYHWQHEPILYGWKPTAAHKWHSDRTQTTLWHFDRPFASKLHPTMKPIDLVSYPIRNSSTAGDIVLDPFGGSGSTLIACEQLNRFCRMVELDPRYYDVIVRRYAEWVGPEYFELRRNGEVVDFNELFGELNV